MSRLDIVCPYIERDKERFDILWTSIEKYLKIPNYRLFLVSPDGKKPIKSSKIIAIKEKDLDINLSSKEFNGKGWWKQQIIKLLSYRFCNTDCILSIDCDCFLTKNLYYKNITFKNKPILSLNREGSWENWYRGSKAILKLNPKHSEKIGVTPFLFSRSILKSLDLYLDLIYGKNKTATLLSRTSPTMTAGDTWSEYVLYHIYSDYTGLINKYHHIDSTFEMSGNNIWLENETDSWNPEKSFKKPKHFFTVVQSTANRPASWVKSKVSKFIYD